jgi:HSP20 family protein
MTLVKWTNRLPINNVFDDMDTVFHKLFEKGIGDNGWVPSFNIKETEKQFVLFADLPGLTKKDIEIDVSEGVLSVSGERKNEESQENDVWLTFEQNRGAFSRAFNLPENIDESKISAKFKNGVLKVELPKTEPVQPVVNRISIK